MANPSRLAAGGLSHERLEPEGDALPNEKALAEHFFQAGRESMAKEFWTARPKRTIVQLISHNGDLQALTSDGRIYRLMEDEFGDESWVRDEDSIPQGD